MVDDLNLNLTSIIASADQKKNEAIQKLLQKYSDALNELKQLVSYCF
jgi:hypothetical protein